MPISLYTSLPLYFTITYSVSAMPKVTKAAPAPSTHRTAPYPASTNASLPPSTNDQRPPVSAWNASDDDQLMLARAQGLNWQPIATTYFPSKTANACRKRHERLMERRNAENWDGIKVEELAKAYLEVREEMWKILASKVGEGKWTVVEEKVGNRLLPPPPPPHLTPRPLHRG